MIQRRRICVVTGSRAEYGLLYWLMHEIRGDPELDLQIVVTGMHLSPEFGLTYKVIEQDKFLISDRIEMLLSADSPTAVAKSVGIGVMGFADSFARLQPDIVVVLGDRFEILAAAQTAMIMRLPLAHIHGGEVTEGAIDESIRHAITKMANFHFVAAEPYRKRVIQLGESPERVMNFGAPGLDNLRRLALLDRKELEKEIGFSLGKCCLLVTYHPATLGKAPEEACRELLAALGAFPQARLIFTKANADAHGRVINCMIDDYVAANGERATAFTSMGQLRYLSALRAVDAMIGNSSSGLTEAPALRKPTVNVGDRQKGRLRAASVIDVTEDVDAIVAGIHKALSVEFQSSLDSLVLPYGNGDASARIKDYLKNVTLGGSLLSKQFHDLAIS